MHEFHEFLDRRYAIALYEVAEEKGKVDSYISELDQVSELMNNNKDLLEIINHPDLSTSRKKEIFENIFKGNIENDILSFLIILVDKNRFDELNAIVDAIKKIHLERNEILSAIITTVIPLNEEEKNALIAKLRNKYNKKIVLTEEIDQSILGGVLVRVGNDVIDGTIRGKLDKIKRLTLKTN
jgi:F-type H+-transporting ATPase subunit delta